MIIGHVPREMARIFYFFLAHDGTIHAEVIGHRRFGVDRRFHAAIFFKESLNTSSGPRNYYRMTKMKILSKHEQ